MRRVAVTLDSELDKSLREYLNWQEAPPTLTALMHVALSEFLSRRGFSAPAPGLEITPARRGSGSSDVSLHHDQYLAKPR
ncbi:MAG: hypothetical protein ACKV22_00040 [Bryobacteraceae bacterium]